MSASSTSPASKPTNTKVRVRHSSASAARSSPSASAACSASFDHASVSGRAGSPSSLSTNGSLPCARSAAPSRAVNSVGATSSRTSARSNQSSMRAVTTPRKGRAPRRATTSGSAAPCAERRPATSGKRSPRRRATKPAAASGRACRTGHTSRTSSDGSAATRRASTSRMASEVSAEARAGDEDAAAGAQQLDDRRQLCRATKAASRSLTTGATAGAAAHRLLGAAGRDQQLVGRRDARRRA